MSLKIVETSLNNVKPEYQSLYVKNPNGTYHLDVDLEKHVAPLKTELATSKLESALKKVNVRPDHIDLLMRRLGDRIAIDAEDGKSVVRILPAKADGMSLVGNLPGDASTLEDLVAETAREFPFLFGQAPAQTATGKGENALKVLTRDEFERLPPIDRASKMADGYHIVDNPPAPPRKRAPGEKILTRTEFDGFGAKERAAKMADGFKVVD